MADLIQRSDIVARIGTLNPAQDARVDALIADASALARSEGPWLENVTNDVVVLQLNGNRLTLPSGPVTSITEVRLVGIPTPGGDLVIPNGYWALDGIDQIVLDQDAEGWIINMPEAWWVDYGAIGTYRVTYSHGFTTTPPEVVAVVCNMVNRVLTSPSMAEGLTGENIGQYGYQMSQQMGAMGSGVRITEADRSILRNPKFRRGLITIETPI
jgi:hypothetical protein